MTLGFAVLGVLLVLYLLLGARRGDVSGAEARRLIEQGALLLDVRSGAEFAAGHLPGAINLPIDELDRRMGELGPKDRSIVLYCRSGHRSGRARAALADAGFVALHDLGAMSRW